MIRLLTQHSRLLVEMTFFFTTSVQFFREKSFATGLLAAAYTDTAEQSIMESSVRKAQCPSIYSHILGYTNTLKA